MTASSSATLERSRKFVGREFHASQEDEIRGAFDSWRGMLERCFLPRTADADRRYRARGITVCEAWFSFSNFLADMGPRPAGLTLERENNDGDYEPGNCRWATRTEQARNTSRTKLIDLGGRRTVQSALAAEVGVSDSTISRRVRAGLKSEQVASGAHHLARKLDADAVRSIRARSAGGESDSALGREFGVSHSCIRQIRLRLTWRHL